MMTNHNIYIVIFELHSTSRDYSYLYDAFRQYPIWGKLTDNAYCVDSTENAMTIRNKLVNFISDNDRLMVIQFDVLPRLKTVGFLDDSAVSGLRRLTSALQFGDAPPKYVDRRVDIAVADRTRKKLAAILCAEDDVISDVVDAGIGGAPPVLVQTYIEKCLFTYFIYK